MKFYCESKETVLENVASQADGLSNAEAEKRLAENGKNKLVEAKKESMLHRFFKQLAEPMTIILLVAAFAHIWGELLTINFSFIVFSFAGFHEIFRKSVC